MKTKEKIIRKSISILEDKIFKIDQKLNIGYEIIECLKERSIWIDSKDFTKALLVQDRIDQLIQLNKKIDTNKLIKLKVKYEFEISELKNELYFLNS